MILLLRFNNVADILIIDRYSFPSIPICKNKSESVSFKLVFTQLSIVVKSLSLIPSGHMVLYLNQKGKSIVFAL